MQVRRGGAPDFVEVVGVVDQVVEDSVGDDIVSMLDRHLAGDVGRTALVAIVDDFEDERGEAPIVEDEQLAPFDSILSSRQMALVVRPGRQRWQGLQIC